MTAQANLLLLRDREALVTDWERCTDQIKELGDQIRALASVLSETLRPALEAFAEQVRVFYVTFLRTQLQMVLMRRWHIPNDIAYWLSQWWPRRWLPKLRPELWEGDEKETVT